MALDVAAFEACGGDVGLPALADAGAAGGAGYKVCVAFAADLAAEVGGQVGAGALGDLAGEVDVALGELGVPGVCGLCLLEEGADPFQGDLGVLFGHFGLPFGRVWGLGIEFIRVGWVFGLLQRGRAARLARGAHNPKVGSSNLPPATIFRVMSGSIG